MKGGPSFIGVCHASPLLSPNYSVPMLGRIKAAEIEIRVCVNRTCRRQGSIETLQILSAIAPPDVTVSSCGCLGRCGAGPNLVVLPDGTVVGHCGTGARAADIMWKICGGDGLDSWSNSLEALALRKRAEDEMDKDNFSQAELLLSQAIDLKPSGGIHIIYKDRSAARLAMGNMSAALQDAEEALTLAPNYPEAYIYQGDAFMAMEQFDSAGKSYSTALELDPSIRRSKSFKGITKVEGFPRVQYQLVELVISVHPSLSPTMGMSPLTSSILTELASARRNIIILGQW